MCVCVWVCVFFFFFCSSMVEIRELSVDEATDLVPSSRSTGAVLVNPPIGVHMMAQFCPEIDT